MASSRLITRYDGLRSADLSPMDLVHKSIMRTKMYEWLYPIIMNRDQVRSSNAAATDEIKTAEWYLFDGAKTRVYCNI